MASHDGSSEEPTYLSVRVHASERRVIHVEANGMGVLWPYVCAWPGDVVIRSGRASVDDLVRPGFSGFVYRVGIEWRTRHVAHFDWGMAMHLVLGSREDSCCLRVLSALQAAGYSARIVDNPLGHSALFSLKIGADGVRSQLGLLGQERVANADVAGVLVRGAGWIDSRGWEPGDLAYVHAETQAALLAWLWSLPCTVLNRYAPALWYRPRMSPVAWRGLLTRCGLRAPRVLVTNVEGEARTFGSSGLAEGIAGLVYTPLTGDAQYLVGNTAEWEGLVALQQRAPVCLTIPHAESQRACVVGDSVVWDGPAPGEAHRVEPLLRQFARAAGLGFVEMLLAETDEGWGVVGVDHQPNFELFGAAAQRDIVAALVRALTAAPQASSPSHTRAES